MSKKNPHWGSTLDSFLSEEGIREAARTEATTRVAAWEMACAAERNRKPA